MAISVGATAVAGYREDHIELFRITEAPLVIDHYLAADFEPASELVVGWKNGTLDLLSIEIIAESIARLIPVVVFAESAGDEISMRSKLLNAGVPQGSPYLRFEITERDTPWVGDYGLLAIHHISSGKISLVDPRHHDPRPLDDKVPTEIAATLGINVFRPSILLPRSVITNGWWTCLLSERDELENLPDPDAAGLVTLMENYLGCTEVVFLPSLVNAGSGDLSQALAFLDRDSVIVGSLTGDVDCANADRLDAIAETLASVQAPGGGTLHVIRLPFPSDIDGTFRSYTDLVFVNGGAIGGEKIVFVPQFPGFPDQNSQAVATVSNHLSGTGWEVYPIDAGVLAGAEGGLGSLVANLPFGDYSAHQPPPDMVCGDQSSCQSTGCGNVTYEGFCTNDSVVWCENTQIFMTECSTPCSFVEPGSPCELSCGWSPLGYNDCVDDYTCGQPEIFLDGFESGDTSAWSN